MDPEDQLPPHSIEAEQGLIGSVLLDSEVALKFTKEVTPECFYDLRHQVLWNRIQSIGTPVDPSMVVIGWSAEDRDAAGGVAYISELPALVPSAHNAPVYVAEVLRCHRARQILQQCREITESITSGSHPDEILEDAELRFGSIARSAKRNALDVHVSWEELLAFDPDKDPNCLVGVSPAGKTTRFLCRGYGAWLIGPSGIGKSSLAVYIALAWCLGRPAFGMRPTRALRILLVQAENDLGDLAEQVVGILHCMGMDYAADDVLRENLKIKSVKGKIGAAFCGWLRAEIELHRADLVVIDPLLSFAGIDVSRQDQCSMFLRGWLDPVLAETGAALLSVHHTGKPKGENGGPKHRSSHQTVFDLMYQGLGSSELVNWARAAMLVQPIDEETFRLNITKRGRRAWATHPNGDQTIAVYLKHTQGFIGWIQTDPVEEPVLPSGPGRKPVADQVLSKDLQSFLDALGADVPLSKSKCGEKMAEWLENEHGEAITGKTAGDKVLPKLVSMKVLKFDGSKYSPTGVKWRDRVIKKPKSTTVQNMDSETFGKIDPQEDVP